MNWQGSENLMALCQNPFVNLLCSGLPIPWPIPCIYMAFGDGSPSLYRGGILCLLFPHPESDPKPFVPLAYTVTEGGGGLGASLFL